MTGQRILHGYSDEPFEILNNDFVRDGYEFTGWNTKPDGSGTALQPNLIVDIQKDTVLYALWKLVYVYMNLVRNGDVNVASNIATFGSNSYLRTPSYFNLTNNSVFELMLKFTTSDDVNTSQTLFRQSGSYDYGLYIENSKLIYRATNTASNISLAANTTYYLKVVKNCPVLEVYLSNNGNNFTKVLSINHAFNVLNQYFTFGYNKQYDVQEQYDEPKQVKKFHTPAYTTYEDRWITDEQHCAYGNRNGRIYTYEQKLKHATSSKYRKNGTANSNNCGYWYLNYPVQHPASGPYYETVIETKYRTVKREHYNFKGIMDFNESYFVLNSLKHKLKA